MFLYRSWEECKETRGSPLRYAPKPAGTGFMDRGRTIRRPQGSSERCGPPWQWTAGGGRMTRAVISPPRPPPAFLRRPLLSSATGSPGVRVHPAELPFDLHAESAYGKEALGSDSFRRAGVQRKQVTIHIIGYIYTLYT